MEAQDGNPQSLLWWMRRLIALRRRHRAFGRGTLEFLDPENRKVLAFLRRFEAQTLLVVANLSRFVQHVSLDLAAFKGLTPVELFGRTRFPPIAAAPTFLTLGPHAFYWFALEPAPAEPVATTAPGSAAPPAIALPGGWPGEVDATVRAALEDALPAILRGRKWFAGHGRPMRSARLAAAVPVPSDADGGGFVLLARVEYTEGEAETYAVPACFASVASPTSPPTKHPESVLARVEAPGEGKSGVLFEASFDAGFARSLLGGLPRRRRWKGNVGEIAAVPEPALKRLLTDPSEASAPSPLEAGRSHVSVAYGTSLVLKLDARLEPGTSPDVEIPRFLAAHAPNAPVATLAGSLEYRGANGDRYTIGTFAGFVRNEENAWHQAIDALGRCYERVLSPGRDGAARVEAPALPIADLATGGLPPAAAELLGTYVPAAVLLGRRTAQLHTALSASSVDDPEFVPETVDTFYRKALYHSLRWRADHAASLLRRHADELPPATRERAQEWLSLDAELDRRFRAYTSRESTMARIRIHGDFRLRKVLSTGSDFVVIDFAGDPARPLSERRIKRAALRDVAGMIASFQAAARCALRDLAARGSASGHPGAAAALEAAAVAWPDWASAAFLEAYVAAAGGAAFLPKSRDELRAALDAYLLDHRLADLCSALEQPQPEGPGPDEPLRSLLHVLSVPRKP